MHKVLARAGSVLAAWLDFEARFAAATQVPGLTPHGAPPILGGRRDAEIDVAAFRCDWAAQRSVEGHAALPARHGLARLQALRLAGPRFALRLDEDSAREVLRAVAWSGVPITVQVGNAGATQAHSGPLRRVELLRDALHVSGAGFSLRLREDHIEQAWLVRRPTSGGLVTWLELFDLMGDAIATLQRQGDRGRPEPCTWRHITDRLAADPAWADGDSACGAC